MVGAIGELTVLGTELITFSPVLLPPGSSGEGSGGLVYAFVRWDLESGEPRNIQPLVGFGREEEQFTSGAGPLLAAAGDRVVLLTLLDGSFRLQQAFPEQRLLDSFPERFSSPPRFPTRRGPEASTAFFAFLERSTLPQQLYGRGDHLYLLTREPSDGATRWSLHQIDPVADRLVRTMVLPTRTEHLFLVPGPRRWALVEKGPVTGLGEQAIRSVVLVPTRWVEDPASGVLGADAPPRCSAAAPEASSGAS